MSDMQSLATAARNGGAKPKESSLTKMETVLDNYHLSISQAIPTSKRKELSAERIIQLSATVIAANAKLGECTPGSIVGAVLQIACLGLNPLPVLAEAYLVPIAGKCELWIGYRGWINLFHRCPIIRDITAHVVCEGDEFSFAYGLDPHLLHTPDAVPNPNGSNVTHAYAIAHYTNGGSVFVVLTKKEIDGLGNRGGGTGPAWKTDFEAMAQAKAIKRLRRYIPSDGSDMDAAVAVDGGTMDIEKDFDQNGGGVNLLDISTGSELAEVLEEGDNE